MVVVNEYRDCCTKKPTAPWLAGGDAREVHRRLETANGKLPSLRIS
jgi:hypothetical protein